MGKHTGRKNYSRRPRNRTTRMKRRKSTYKKPSSKGSKIINKSDLLIKKKVVKKWCTSVGHTKKKKKTHGYCEFVKNYRGKGDVCLCDDGDIITSPDDFFKKKFGAKSIYKGRCHLGIINWNKVNS